MLEDMVQKVRSILLKLEGKHFLVEELIRQLNMQPEASGMLVHQLLVRGIIKSADPGFKCSAEKVSTAALDDAVAAWSILHAPAIYAKTTEMKTEVEASRVATSSLHNLTFHTNARLGLLEKNTNSRLDEVHRDLKAYHEQATRPVVDRSAIVVMSGLILSVVMAALQAWAYVVRANASGAESLSMPFSGWQALVLMVPFGFATLLALGMWWKSSHSTNPKQP